MILNYPMPIEYNPLEKARELINSIKITNVSKCEEKEEKLSRLDSFSESRIKLNGYKGSKEHQQDRIDKQLRGLM